MSESSTATTSFWQKALLILGGVAFAVLLVVIGLMLFPQLIPGADFAERQYAGTTIEVTFTEMDGDLFADGNRVRPLVENRTLEAYTLAWDADGFRVPARVADRYPIAAIGDSFTEGAQVPLPWPDRLAELLDTPVRNYAYRNYGPFESLDVVREYVAQEPREWLIYGFFSGNELGDMIRTEQQRISARTPEYLLPFLFERAADRVPPLDPERNYTYPMPVIVGGSYYDMAFNENWMWWQLAPEDGFADSATFDRMGQVLDVMAETVGPQTCRTLVFIPSKLQLYWPYVDWNGRRYLLYVAQRPAPEGPDGLLLLRDAPLTDADDDALIARLNEQRDAVRDLADARGWLFIDLLDPFRERIAAEEALLYYRYDTHWNQAGHDLAAQLIAEALRDAGGC